MKSFRKEDVIGKTAIDTSGKVMGKVTDVMFDLNGSITFVVGSADGKQIQVPVTRITGISDHVIVRSEQLTGTETSAAGASCKFCGASLKAGERWCPKCGKSQV